MFGALLKRLGGRNQSIGRLLVTFMVVGFASLVIVGIAAAVATQRNQQHIFWVNHTYEVELAIDRATIFNERAETTRRGYLLTGQPIYLGTYATATAQLSRNLARVAAITLDNPIQRANIALLRAHVAEMREQRDRTIALVKGGDIRAGQRAFTGETSARRMRAIRDLSQAMVVEEQRLLAIRDAERRASISTFYGTLVVAGVLLLLVAGLSLATVLNYTRDLAASRDLLRDFADSLEDQVTERTADLSRANEEIQRFAYIVSHDLRAPLVNVMGFTAELDAASASLRELIDRAEETAPDIVTEEAREAARADLPEAIAFIRTSTEKMDRLINAILKLAREGRRMLAPEAIDMTALAETIRGSLQHRLEGRGTTLVIEALPDIVSDRLAIEQIFSNLVENAVKYLKPDQPGHIVLRGTRQLARVVFEIEDDGRGIAPVDHQRIFDLFRRSGNQDQPGEGIGLAHVRALAYRLGGVIDVRSALGEGAIFRLSLPATLADLQEPTP